MWSGEQAFAYALYESCYVIALTNMKLGSVATFVWCMSVHMLKSSMSHCELHLVCGGLLRRRT